jgi:hypothetical protein
MFLHGGWFHIINNMWVLLIFGDNVEAGMGKIRYLIFYLLSGLAAGLLQTYILPTSLTPMIGASGAVAGVLGAYLILYSALTDCQPGAHPVHFYHRGNPCHAVPDLLVCLAVVFRVARHPGRWRERDCLVGTYWRFCVWRAYGVFLSKTNTLSNELSVDHK